MSSRKTRYIRRMRSYHFSYSTLADAIRSIHEPPKARRSEPPPIEWVTSFGKQLQPPAPIGSLKRDRCRDTAGFVVQRRKGARLSYRQVIIRHGVGHAHVASDGQRVRPSRRVGPFRLAIPLRSAARRWPRLLWWSVEVAAWLAGIAAVIRPSETAASIAK